MRPASTSTLTPSDMGTLTSPPSQQQQQQQQQQNQHTNGTTGTGGGGNLRAPRDRAADDAKLIFGTVFSLRNMVRKLGGEDDAFISYRTAQYKLHYYETPTNLRFALLTEPAALSMRNVLHQIYINLWVEYGESICLRVFFTWGGGGGRRWGGRGKGLECDGC